MDDKPTLYVGMSRDRLRSRFGEPLRVEAARAGGENWFYPFATCAPNIEGNAENDGTYRSASVSVTISDQKSTQEFPVHLSADGCVIEPLPPGEIVRK